MGEETQGVQGRSVLSPTALPRPALLTQSSVVERGSKVHLQKENKKGKKETAEGSMLASASRATSRAAKSTRL